MGSLNTSITHACLLGVGSNYVTVLLASMGIHTHSSVSVALQKITSMLTNAPINVPMNNTTQIVHVSIVNLLVKLAFPTQINAIHVFKALKNK